MAGVRHASRLLSSARDAKQPVTTGSSTRGGRKLAEHARVASPVLGRPSLIASERIAEAQRRRCCEVREAAQPPLLLYLRSSPSQRLLCWGEVER